MKATSKKVKFTSALLIILIIATTILLSGPKQADAVGWPTWDAIGDFFTGAFVAPGSVSGAAAGGGNLGLHIKDIATEVLKELVRTLEKKLLQDLTKGMVNWINSGFHGAPLFLQNPGSFFNDIAKSEVETMVGLIGYDPNQYPFGQSFALNIINSYKRSFANDAAYSMNTLMSATQATNFRNNFNTGGWNGFLINTQYPQNNYLGFNMMATDQLARQLQGTTQNAAQKVQSTLQQGNGFLSPQKCATNPNYNNGINEFQAPQWNNDQYMTDHPYPTGTDCGNPPDINLYNTPDETGSTAGGMASYQAVLQIYQSCTANNQAALNTWNQNLATAQASFNSPTGTNVCPKTANGSSGLVATTPGSVAGSQIMKALGANIDQGTLGAAVGDSIGAVLDSLVNHFADVGLAGLASVVNPPPPVDTWTYQGQTLTGTTTGTPPPANTPGACYTNVGGTALTQYATQAACGNANDVWIATAPAATLPAGSTPGCYSTGIDGSLNPIATATTTDNCTLAGGTWYGTTPTTLSGCYSVDGTIAMTDVTTTDACSAAGGIWNGPPTAEPPEDCFVNNQIVTGITDQNSCATVGGTWGVGSGAGTGSCAASDGTALPNITDQTTCSGITGIWNSSSNTCAASSDGTTLSNTTTQSACGNINGVWTPGS